MNWRTSDGLLIFCATALKPICLNGFHSPFLFTNVFESAVEIIIDDNQSLAHNGR